MSTYKGACFCGSVHIEDPPASRRAWAIANCRSCRSWSGGPVNAFIPVEARKMSRVTEGEQHVVTFTKSPASERKYCIKCGGHLMVTHPGLGLVDVFAAGLPTLPFKAGLHINYAETVLADARRPGRS